jgi:hypothetical protein
MQTDIARPKRNADTTSTGNEPNMTALIQILAGIIEASCVVESPSEQQKAA